MFIYFDKSHQNYHHSLHLLAQPPSQGEDPPSPDNLPSPILLNHFLVSCFTGLRNILNYVFDHLFTSYSLLIFSSKNTKKFSNIFKHDEGPELSLTCIPLSVYPRTALSKLVSWKEEKMILVIIGQEGGLGRLEFFLEEVAIFYTIWATRRGW